MKSINLLYIILLLTPAFNNTKCQETKSKIMINYFTPHLAGEVFYPSFTHMGSQYFIEDWSEGSIILESGEVADKIQLKYNGFLDELIWMKTPSFQQIKLDKYLVKEFTIINPRYRKTHRFKRIELNLPPFNTKSEIFAEVIYEDKVSLFAFRRITATGKVNRKTDKGIFQFIQIDPDYLYFITKPGEANIFLSKISRKSLYRAFPEMKQEIRAIFNQTRGYSTNEERFALIVKKINESY
jgi:hypothetical protein